MNIRKNHMYGSVWCPPCQEDTTYTKDGSFYQRVFVSQIEKDFHVDYDLKSVKICNSQGDYQEEYIIK